ncbi:MAG: carbamoyl-phosphate synthase L chain ATP-binding protein [Gammaproteobacteria bacterium TMED159]|nr:MAG: carbamoyl-phosphate synthase L chain ATP-binding protein [Gammaproteobacteria bacterium TMED159]RCL40919.1 MAG: biotin/lipoyl-binding protein [Gammaproteobacteria bacterium]
MIIRKLLISNRGEIASRIIRSAHDMGISCVAIYTEADTNTPYVREADQAFKLSDTYLNAKEILEIAKKNDVDAIHPGYGFLSENANFANSVKKAGIKWVGPSANAIKKMGDKLTAKTLAEKVGVPTLPMGTSSKDAKNIGYPILVKAAAGGGGKGMRIVEDAKDLKESIASAEREAEGGFGDKRVFLERYIERSRHIEVQILGDSHGNLVHLGERECSIQRRHQKIIEESPSPMVSDSMRREMGAAALKLASKLKYESAGTVEFLVDEKTKEFWFLEVNTRLQVEHPVTEEVTGIDLVKEQLRIADGEELGFDQSDVDWFGSSIEVRLYAEDPGNDFLPVTGKLIRFEPANNPVVRWDVGIETGSIITSDFDPMLAKVISYGETRIEAANKLVLALKNSHFGGMKTNREFLISILESKEFLKGATTTDFIKKVKLNTELGLSEDEINDYAKLAALWIQGKNRNEASVLTNMESGWNNARLPFQEVKLKMNELETSIKYKNTRNNIFKFSDKKNGVVFEWKNNFIDAEISGSRYRSKVSKDKDLLLLHTYKGDVLFKILPKFKIQEIGIVEGGLNAPMPGKVVEVKIKKGSSVKKGDTLVILEAMKMEHKVSAPANGKISKVLISQGDQVENGQTLIVLD